MIIPENFSGIFRTSVLRKYFPWFEKMGIKKENPQSVYISEVAPDEVAVFCSLTAEIVSLTFISFDNQKSFDYQKMINDELLIIPLREFNPIPSRGNVAGITTREEPWWIRCGG
jgi:hypothetical protein